MAIVVLFFFFLFAALVMASMAGPALADLLRRENAVQWWYPLPLIVCATILAPIPLIFLDDGLGWSAVEGLSMLLAFFHLALAGISLWLGISLAAVRGLRPGGPTTRKFRTSLVAVVVLALLGVQPALLALSDEDYLIGMSWLGFGCFAGIFWVAAVNRRGPYRLTEGRRWSAGFLLASFFQLGLCVAHFYWMIDHGYPHDAEAFTPVIWIAVGVVSATLALGLRFLAGPLPWQPLVACAASTPTLLGPITLFSLWRPVPAGTPLPTWTDLSGQPGIDKGIERYMACVQVHGVPTSSCRSWEQRFYAAPPDLPLDQIPDDVHLLAGSGKISTDSGWGWGAQATIRAAGNEAIATWVAPPDYGTQPGPPVQVPVGPELQAWLKKAQTEEGVLMVERNPAWTVQDYISMCASWPWRCELMPK